MASAGASKIILPRLLPLLVGVLAANGFTAHSNESFMSSLLISLGLTTALEPKDGQTQYVLDLEGLAAVAPEAFASRGLCAIDRADFANYASTAVVGQPPLMKTRS